MAKRFAETVARGKTIFFCGNGGSAAEAQHLATELVGRFLRDRRALPAIALTADSALITSVGNDSGFGSVFARQIEALGKEGDLLVAMTTSGRSPNVLAAVEAARARGLTVLGMTGARGAGFAHRCDLCLIVPSEDTPRIQEVHLVVGHLWCERAESVAAPGGGERAKGGDDRAKSGDEREEGGERARRGGERAEGGERAKRGRQRAGVGEAASGGERDKVQPQEITQPSGAAGRSSRKRRRGGRGRRRSR